ncbi:MAG: ATP-binding cassette domain-containing protein [Bacteroidota bacterium]
MRKPIIIVNNISIFYDKKRIIEDFTFQVKSGEKVVITGESGKGKTSLLNAILGFTPIKEGEIFLFGRLLSSENISKIRNKTAWLPQETSLNFDSVNDIIYMPFEFKINKLNYPSKDAIDTVFKNLNISKELLNKQVDEISGGQKQRLLLASSLLLKKEVLIIDEPTSALDEDNKKRITNYILSKKKLTVIAATHDPYWIKKSDQIIVL